MMFKRFRCTVWIVFMILGLLGCGGRSSGGSTSSITASGIIIDNDSGSELAGAAIVSPDGEETSCDAEGLFSMEVTPGQSLMFSVIASGYKSTLICLDLSSSRDDIEILMVSSSSDDLPPIIYFSDDDAEVYDESFSAPESMQAQSTLDETPIEEVWEESADTYSFSAGWSQVSFPFETITSVVSTGTISNILFHFNPFTSSYDFAFADNPSTLNDAYGYWLYAYEDTDITITGDYSAQDQVSFDVKPGFNCFGLPYTIEPIWGLEQVMYQGSTYYVHEVVDLGWFGSTLFWYNDTSQSYDFSFAYSKLTPCKGYWLYSEIECTLIFPSTIPSTGVVSGVITNTATTDPLRGIVVSIGDITDTTDSSGEYCLYNVPIGAQTITTSGPGFDLFSDTVNIVSGGVTPKNLAITPVAAIYGIITD